MGSRILRLDAMYKGLKAGGSQEQVKGCILKRHGNMFCLRNSNGNIVKRDNAAGHSTI